MSRKIFQILTVVSVLAFANAVDAWCSPDRKSEKEKVAQMVKDAVKKQELKVEISTIMPTGAPSITTTDGYTVEVKDGKINGRLPYFGTSDMALIAGVDETGIAFEDCPIEIKVDNSKAAKGKYMWSFEAVSGRESIQVYMEIWDSGSVTINCHCSRRSSISYLGEIR